MDTTRQNTTETQRKRTRKMSTENSYTSIITLNVNGLNSPIKRQSDRLNQKTKADHMLSSGDTSELQRQS